MVNTSKLELSFLYKLENISELSPALFLCSHIFLSHLSLTIFPRCVNRILLKPHVAAPFKRTRTLSQASRSPPLHSVPELALLFCTQSYRLSLPRTCSTTQRHHLLQRYLRRLTISSISVKNVTSGILVKCISGSLYTPFEPTLDGFRVW